MVKNHSGTNAVRRKQVGESPVTIDFGTRAVSDQNFSKIVALPKQALANLGQNVQRLSVELVQEKTTKYIRLRQAQDEEKRRQPA